MIKIQRFESCKPRQWTVIVQTTALMILLILSLSSVITSRAAIVFSEDFDDGNFDGWTVTGTSLFSGARTVIAKGNFSATDKTLRATGTTKPGAYSILTHPTITTKGTWSWDLYFNKEGTMVGYTGIVTFADKPVVTTPLDWSAYGIQIGDSGTLTFMRYQNGFDTQIGYGKFTSKPGSWTHIDLTRNEKGRFCLYADGNLSMNVTDIKISTFEYFGFWLVPGPAIDNIVVSDSMFVPPGSLKINVKDSAGNALSGVTASSSKQPSGQLALSGTSVADGSVTFTGLAIGDYTIQASKSGYVAGSAQGGVVSGAQTELSITLQAQPSSGIPGYPISSIITGVLLSVTLLWLFKRKLACALDYCFNT